ncbi:MAG: glutamine synthetase beta-grasp domain-containing protein, partial [Bacteroidetes bacterium]|nr:glutamine synthetase beta-grasp domain-containing protein [Bacteroidota bacterium]
MSVEMDRVNQLVKEHHIEFIDLKTIDLVGRLHHITLPLREGTLQSLMDQGVGFDGSSFGFAKVENSDMVQKPDLSTVQIDLFRNRPTLTCFTNVFLTDEKRSRFVQDVRWVARHAEELLTSLGIADGTHWGPELEYYIFSQVDFDTRTSASFYNVDHAEEFFQ